MLDSVVFEHVLDSSSIHLSQDWDEGEANEDDTDEDVTQNTWKTSTYQQRCDWSRFTTFT